MTVITPLKTPKECFDTLVNLYERKIPSQKRKLKTKLKYAKMEKGELVSSFFTKISQIRDQLQVVGVKVDDDDLVQAVFVDLPLSWETFLSNIIARRINQIFRSNGTTVFKRKEEFGTRVDLPRKIR